MVNQFPVLYLDQNTFDERLKVVTQSIYHNSDLLKNVGQGTIFYLVHLMLIVMAIGIKHPGFAEEKEWRIYIQQSGNNKYLEEIVVVDGIPQEILKLPFKISPLDQGVDSDITSVLDRIIIGPTEHPEVSRHAFIKILENAGVDDAIEKVVVSDIPLRTRA